jgi:hypothetical protein
MATMVVEAPARPGVGVSGSAEVKVLGFIQSDFVLPQL